jgi:hypothetical protein
MYTDGHTRKKFASVGGALGVAPLAVDPAAAGISRETR